MNDEELMRRLKAGDTSALALLHERHAPKVWSYLIKRVPEESAKDMFQDCFVRIVEKREHWNGQPFVLWMYVVLRNLVVDHHRKYKTEQKYLERMSPEEQSVQESPDFQELVSQLSPDASRLLNEFFQEGLSYKDLSERYQVSEVSLRKRMSRALGLLKKGEWHER